MVLARRGAACPLAREMLRLVALRGAPYAARVPTTLCSIETMVHTPPRLPEAYKRTPDDVAVAVVECRTFQG